MKLTEARVENFKCVDDSTPFKIGPITCLVGKNEAGKTALLEALHRLNPIVEADAHFASLEYPRRRWSEYKERAADNPDNVLTTTWAVEDADRAAVEDILGPGAFTQKTVEITKGYSNACRWPDLVINEARVVKQLIRSADLHTEEAKRLQSAQVVQQLLKRLKEIENPSEREEAFTAHIEFILLDEPGLSLHGRAQRDLLRYFNERIVPQSPLIYTTHSPFMTDPENILSVRTVEDVVEEDDARGTKVGSEILSTDHDTIFPLQAALCYDVSQTLFIGEYPLLVEGPSDLLYLKWFSRQLRLRGRTHLDSRWTISVAGGIDKMTSFVTLFSGKGLNTAVFSDFHVGDKKKLERLRALKIFDEGRVLTASSYAGGAEADIEDMIGAALYIAIVDKTYKLDGKNAMPERASSGRVAAEVKKRFGTLPPDLPPFDHYEPAVYLTENIVEPGVGHFVQRARSAGSEQNPFPTPW